MSLRDDAIRLASEKPEYQDDILHLVMAHDAYDRVVKARRGGGRWDEVWIGKDVRVSYHDSAIKVEEIPSKPLRSRRMNLADISLFYPVQSLHLSEYLGQNLIRDAKLKKSMDYDKVMSALRKAIEKADKAVEERGVTLGRGMGAQIFEEQVHYLQVVPVDAKPVSAQAKDFSVHSEWDNFSAYSPDSDLQSHDPYYSKVVNKSPAAARKLFKILKADPKALSKISWSEFTDWLKSKKVKYDMQFSPWR